MAIKLLGQPNETDSGVFNRALDKKNLTCVVTQETFLPKLGNDFTAGYGTGGLSFLNLELMLRAREKHWNVMGIMPGYEKTPKGEKIPWDTTDGVRLLSVGGKDSFSIPWGDGGKEVQAQYYTHEIGPGVPWIFAREVGGQNINERLYPEDYQKRLRQCMFLALAAENLFKQLGQAPDMLLAHESQQVEVLACLRAMVMDKRASADHILRIVTVCHTSQQAARMQDLSGNGWLHGAYGDAYYLQWLQDLLHRYPEKSPQAHPDGKDTPDRRLGIGNDGLVTVLNKVQMAAEMSDVLVTVDQDSCPSQATMTPDHTENVVYINNGSDPELWTPEDVLEAYRNNRLTTELVVAAKARGKCDLDQYLQSIGKRAIKDINAMVISAPRRQVKYKRGYVYVNETEDYPALIDHVCGELGATLVITGQPKDRFGKEWSKQFADYEKKYPGQFYYIEDSNIGLMQKVVRGTDLLMHTPHDQEQCGTSCQRILLALGRLIGTNCGWPAHGIRPGVNGWLINVYAQTEMLCQEMGWDDLDPENLADVREHVLQTFLSWNGDDPEHEAIQMMEIFDRVIRAEELKYINEAHTMYTERRDEWNDGMIDSFLTGMADCNVADTVSGYAALAEGLIGGETDAAELQAVINRVANFGTENPNSSISM